MAARLNEVPVEKRGQGPPAADMSESETEEASVQSIPVFPEKKSNGEGMEETDKATPAGVSGSNDQTNMEQKVPEYTTVQSN
ncbi:uncharacterized protein DMAD_00027 [Drosophila madeirensis]|uniref:Uncharacterized protein n=1 Tax=Drosophila madeirensis TaxID=30013 RepID=A0AAU9FWG2_DROMD